MNTINMSYLSRAETWLFITTLAYFFMNGAQLFETAVIIPRWTASPPESLQLFKGQYGLDFKAFWIAMHAVHEITFILAIVFCWKLEPVRNWLLMLFAAHFAVRIWTIAYFAPQIIDFQRMANTGEFSWDLLARVNLWRTLNYLRVAIFVAISLGLLPLCQRLMQMK